MSIGAGVVSGLLAPSLSFEPFALVSASSTSGVVWPLPELAEGNSGVVWPLPEQGKINWVADTRNFEGEHLESSRS